MIMEYLSRQSRNYLLTAGVVTTLLIGLIDFLLPADIGVSIFYLVPISLITWFIGNRAGVLTALGSSALWFIVNSEEIWHVPYGASHYWNTLVRLGYFLTIVFIQSALKAEQLRARIDTLTRLGNRRYFFKAANIELERARRYNRTFTVAYMDLDNFKAVNDITGHSEGDTLLKTVSKTIRSNIRSTDIAARLGGDEFALILPETEAGSARLFCEKLNRHLLQVMSEKHWPVTFSTGVVTFVSPPDSVEDMLSKVDTLMYSAKKSGKNSIRYEIFDKGGKN